MPKNVKTQWDFGDLFSPANTRPPVLTVSELTAKVRGVLERQIGSVWVTGEVSNLRVQSSGHRYFTLKDPNSQLSCVLFRGEAAPHRELLQDGQKLNVQGDLTVYEARGQYQLIVRAMELQGTGALQIAFERLKQKLQAEGLFAPEHKRALPPYPRRIGVVTSPTGAALRDVLHVIQRRQPGLELVLAPSRVQGEGAAAEIAAAIRLLNEWSYGPRASRSHPTPLPGRELDLILITRGGGSLEDLWAFNEEIVAWAIYESVLPVVSAVGHEIDFTISDFVADVRAATPSAAAEIITEGVYASRQFLADAREVLRRITARRLEQARTEFTNLKNRLARLHPRRQINEQLQYLDDLHGSMHRCALGGLRRHDTAWHNLRLRLARLRPSMFLRQRAEHLNGLEWRLDDLVRRRQDQFQRTLRELEARLRLLSPDNVLARGYSITLDAGTGAVIREPAAVRDGQQLRTKLRSGEIRSVVQRE